ncbi:unnamed protein product [Hymenolepis diminuta]|uniref:C2H2-type domain-containing protein n=1 Tax=Hymenolepis diminuta TaxID=6216 RepID=A0A0R3SGG4_HYMDI|nr:unnamed protein product [Hymenolepis diminuta]
MFMKGVDLPTLTKPSTIFPFVDLRPFKCEACERSFAQNHKLKDHIKRVHESKNVAFTSSYLTSLLYLLRPFKCEVCEKYFSRKANLKSHIKTVHEESHGQTTESSSQSQYELKGDKTGGPCDLRVDIKAE